MFPFVCKYGVRESLVGFFGHGVFWYGGKWREIGNGGGIVGGCNLCNIDERLEKASRTSEYTGL